MDKSFMGICHWMVRHWMNYEGLIIFNGFFATAFKVPETKRKILRSKFPNFYRLNAYPAWEDAVF